jgi:predicted small secreted protein
VRNSVAPLIDLYYNDFLRKEHMMRQAAQVLAGLLAAPFLLAGCSTPAHGRDDGFSRAVSRTSAGLDDAALTPLNDFNLRRTEIPPFLDAIVSPYEPVKVLTCGAIASDVGALTSILGPDSDALPGPEDTMGQQLGDQAAGLALDTVSSTVTDFIPFRSVVRQISGATAWERRLRDAYERGIQRRAYLKGIGASMGCAPPAAPDPSAGTVQSTGSRIQYRGTQPD